MRRFCFNGCANHLPQRSEHEARTERKLLDHSLRIELGEPQVLELPQRRIRVQEQKTFEVTDFEVTRRYDRYTPYQPWRELYEIPLGAVAVVAGVGANVLNVVLLGNLPEQATRGWISYGFAGMNPFMNVESMVARSRTLPASMNNAGTHVSNTPACLGPNARFWLSPVRIRMNCRRTDSACCA